MRQDCASKLSVILVFFTSWSNAGLYVGYIFALRGYHCVDIFCFCFTGMATALAPFALWMKYDATVKQAASRVDTHNQLIFLFD